MQYDRVVLIVASVWAFTSWCFCCPAHSVADESLKVDIAAWVKGQIENGQLVVEFYDPAKPPRKFPGWTDFEFRVVYRYDYEYTPLPATPPKKKLPQKKGTIEIRPSFTRIDVPVKSRTLLPNSLDAENWYLASLGKHELEHVFVGAHPRLAMLTRRLIERIQVIEVPDVPAAEITAEWIGHHVDEAVTTRKDAIQTLVTRINAKIDNVTQHGSQAFPDWEKFLEELYLKENLDELKFPYLPEVLDLIESPDYKNARLAIHGQREKALPGRVSKSVEKP